MIADIKTNEEFFAALHKLIDAWCERRCLHSLQYILGPFLGFRGLTDSWDELRMALRTIHGLHQKELVGDELEIIGRLIAAADHAIEM